MNKLYHLCLAAGFSVFMSAANGQRYITETFTDAEITVVQNVQYGENISVEATVLAALSGQTPPPPASTPLFLDVYQPDPSVDTETDRPLIIYLPTGNFLPPIANGSPVGTRKDSSAVNVARLLAKRGYVCAVVEYRKGWNPISTNQIVRTGTILNAAYKGQQDSKAAVRFFRKDKATANEYRIDPDRIALLGEGTGGYIAMAHAYLDAPWKIGRLPGLGDNKFLANVNPASAIDTSVVDTLRIGNFDGTNDIALNLTDFAVSGGDLLKVTGNIANHPGYSSDVNLVINMGGALGDTSWIDPGQIPLIGIHAVRDPNAPYDIGDVIVPTTGDLVIPFASGAGFNVKKMNELGNNASFANKTYSDAITAIVEARYNQEIPFAPGTINTSSGKGLLPFILTPASQRQYNHGAPWQFWSATQFTATQFIPGSTTITTHMASAASNPAMAQSDAAGRATALAYIDTIQRYIHPRIVCALNLAECDEVGIETVVTENAHLMAFPNPAGNNVTLRVKAGAGRLQHIRVFDMTGKLMRTQPGMDSLSVQVERNGLPAGIYLVHVQTEKGSSSVRIVFE